MSMKIGLGKFFEQVLSLIKLPRSWKDSKQGSALSALKSPTTTTLSHVVQASKAL